MNIENSMKLKRGDRVSIPEIDRQGTVFNVDEQSFSIIWDRPIEIPEKYLHEMSYILGIKKIVQHRKCPQCEEELTLEEAEKDSILCDKCTEDMTAAKPIDESNDGAKEFPNFRIKDDESHR